MKRRYVVILLFFMLVLVLSRVIILVNQNQSSSGFIIYRRISTLDGYQKSLGSDRHLYQSIFKNVETGREQHLGYLNGVGAVSPDGNQFVSNCNTDNGMLRVVDISKFYDDVFEKREEYIFEDDSIETIQSRVDFPTEAVLIKKVELPAECKELISEDYGLESISWNPDGDRLAIVCGINATNTWVNYQDSTNRRICFVDLETENSECWEDMDVRSARWSPNSDVLLCSEGGAYDSRIVLVDIDSEERKEVIEGAGVDWSPDGDEIVFVDSKASIKILNLETDEIDVLYELPSYSDYTGKVNSRSYPYFSWSPDGNAIVFEAMYGCSLNLQVYLLDIESKAIRCVSCDNPEYLNSFNPTWGR